MRRRRSFDRSLENLSQYCRPNCGWGCGNGSSWNASHWKSFRENDWIERRDTAWKIYHKCCARSLFITTTMKNRCVLCCVVLVCTDNICTIMRMPNINPFGNSVFCEESKWKFYAYMCERLFVSFYIRLEIVNKTHTQCSTLYLHLNFQTSQIYNIAADLEWTWGSPECCVCSLDVLVFARSTISHNSTQIARNETRALHVNGKQLRFQFNIESRLM